MPDYTIFGHAHGFVGTGTTQTCTGTGGNFIVGPPQQSGDANRPYRYRGIYCKQTATTYRWVYDERLPDTATIPTGWNASHTV